MRFSSSIALICALIYSIFVSFSKLEYYFLIPIFLLLFFQRKEIATIFKKVVLLNLFIGVLVLILLLQKDYDEALEIFLRTNLIILFNVSIFYASKGYDIVRGFYLLSFPKSFISTLYFTIKMIDNLRCDISNIKETLQTRGFKAKSNIFTYYTFGNILGLLFVKSLRRSNALKETFVSRGFDKAIYLNDEFLFSRNDGILIFAIVFMILLKAIL